MSATATRNSNSTDSVATFEDTSLTDPEPATLDGPTKTVHEFRVLHTNVLLSDRKRGELFSRAITGEVSQLSTGAMISRAVFSDVDGRQEYAYQEYHADPHLGGDFGASPPRHASKMRSDIEALSALGVRHLMPTPTMEEVSRFRKEYPWIASVIGLEKNRPAPLFNAGPTTYVFGQNKGGLLALDELHDLLDKHQAGNWGLHLFIDYAPLSTEERWCIDMLPSVNRRNSASVMLGDGPVISEFVLPDPLQAEFRRRFQVPEWIKKPGVAKITTVLRGGIGASMITFAVASV